MTRPEWDSYFLNIAVAVSARADCTRRKVGCVIVDKDNRIIATGYNGAVAGQPDCLSGACPRGLISDEEKKANPSYDYGSGRCISIHAEANALLWARGSCAGATLYVTKAPCPSCQKLIDAAGVARVVVQEGDEGWDLNTVVSRRELHMALEVSAHTMAEAAAKLVQQQDLLKQLIDEKE